jgi:hypothetical protein
MKKLVHSEYLFSRKLSANNLEGQDIVFLTVYIDYEKKTYDIQQSNQEGIFFRDSNHNTEINRAYCELAIEALNFIEKELYGE